MEDIVLTTINAKWIHPSLALRLLKANLGELEDRCEIIEFALRQPLHEKLDALSAAQPRILGISVSIWNHTATIELLKEFLTQRSQSTQRMWIVLGGPEVSHLPSSAEIFNYADYVIRGEGEIVFCELCKKVLAGDLPSEKFINAEEVDVTQIKSAYHLYTDEDVSRKLIYVESSRGCPFNCEFCLSSVSSRTCGTTPLRLCEINSFLSEMDILIKRGVKTFKFLDRTFNANIKRAIQICEFFLEKLKERSFTVHFEIVPTLITPELIETLARFPSGSLRLEIGIQTLNPEVAARINLPARNGKTPEQIIEPLRLLREETNAIIHADLIAGLPGEDLDSFGKSFDLLMETLAVRMPPNSNSGVFSQKKLQTPELQGGGFEVQLGILKQLPGAPIVRHNEEFNMRYNPEPPYEVLETSTMSAEDMVRLKNFARFWEIIVNRSLIELQNLTFNNFMILSDALLTHFGRNWGIDKEELKSACLDIWSKMTYS